jgi:hypothetical protein
MVRLSNLLVDAPKGSGYELQINGLNEIWVSSPALLLSAFM